MYLNKSLYLVFKKIYKDIFHYEWLNQTKVNVP